MKYSIGIKQKITTLVPVVMALSMGVMSRGLASYSYILITIILFIKSYPSFYIIDDNILIVKKLWCQEKIKINTLEFIRRVGPTDNEKVDEKLLSYLIAGANKYVILNKLAKNIKGETIIEALTNQHDIPFKDERARFLIKTKFEAK